jgi:hypothetical protein
LYADDVDGRDKLRHKDGGRFEHPRAFDTANIVFLGSITGEVPLKFCKELKRVSITEKAVKWSTEPSDVDIRKPSVAPSTAKHFLDTDATFFYIPDTYTIILNTKDIFELEHNLTFCKDIWAQNMNRSSIALVAN